MSAEKESQVGSNDLKELMAKVIVSVSNLVNRKSVFAETHMPKGNV